MKTPRLVRGVFFASRSHRVGVLLENRRQEHEAFVMKLNALRLNVAVSAGSSAVADFARIHCTNRAFT